MGKYNTKRCNFQVGGLTGTLAPHYASKYPSVVKHVGNWRSSPHSAPNPNLTNPQLYGMMGGEDSKRDVQNYINSPGYKANLQARINASDYQGGVVPTAEQYIADRNNTLNNTPLKHIRDVDRFQRYQSEGFNDGKAVWETSNHGGVHTYTPARKSIREGEDLTQVHRQVAINPGVAANKADGQYWGLQMGSPYDIGKQLGVEEFLHSTQFPTDPKAGLEFPRMDLDAIRNKESSGNPLAGGEVKASGSQIGENTGNPWETLTPYDRKTIQDSMPSKWELNLDSSSNSKGDDYLYDYLRDPAEMDAKRMATQIQFGLDPSKKLRMRDMKKMLKNPTLQSSHLLRAVSGKQKPEESLLGMKNAKARRETFKRLQPMYSVMKKGGHAPTPYHNDYPGIKGASSKYKPSKIKALQKDSKKKLPDLSSMKKNAANLRQYIKKRKIKEAIIDGKTYQFDSNGRIKI